MGEFFVYILKSSVCLSALYLFYRLLLSRETFYSFNRLAILGILVLSLALPFCRVTMAAHTEVQQSVLTLEYLLMLADNTPVDEAIIQPENATTTALCIRLVLAIYLAGVCFFIGRFVYSMFRLIKLIRSSKRFKYRKGICIATHTNPHYAPFSWLRFIVLPVSDFDEDNNAILIHETAHIRKRHSLDLLIADLCIIFQWFNPAAWLFKQELQNIHEYQADEAVLDHGVNAKQYQLLLIKKAAGTRLYSMANSFNHSKLKKRITMMLKEKSSPWARLKYLYVIPIAAMAITAFARPEISNEMNEFSAVKVNNFAANDSLINAKQAQVTDINNLDSRQANPEQVPLIIVDGEKISQNVLSAIDPEKIKSISVLKDKSATDVYGEEGKNGVVIVELKESESEGIFN